MIRKTLVQGALILTTAALIWFGFSQINFLSLFGIEEKTINTEEKLGRMIWESIKKTETVIHDDSIRKSVDSIVTRITSGNDIDRDKLKVHIVSSPEVNAFAFPGNHLVIFTGLIGACENESELAGVIAHEIAHIERRHVMKKLAREVGLATILSAVGSGGSATGEVVHTLTSSAYDRKLETEADLLAADYLINADIDPEPFAELMFRMATETDLPEAVYWISSHPESESRATTIMNYIKDETVSERQVLSEQTWQLLKQKSSDY